MKKYGDLVIVAMLALLVLGWVRSIDSIVVTKSGYESYYEIATQKREKQLYGLAIKNYKAALAEESRTECVEALAQTCLEYYQSDTSYSAQSLCMNTLEDLIGTYPQISAPYEAEAQLNMDKKDYSAVKTLCEKADTNGASTDTLKALRQQLVYKYTYAGYGGYTDYRTPCAGYYAVCNGSNWGVVSTEGEEAVEPSAVMISSVGEGNYYVASDGTASYIRNLDGYTYANLDFVAEDAGVMAEGLVPIQTGGKYAYYNADGEKQFGDYDAASTFCNGKAAVKNGDAWSIIDATGAVQGSDTFEDLAFSSSGLFNGASAIVAKKNGKFALYDENLAQIGSFTCDEVDLLTSEGFAYAVDGKWGFADYAGNVLIEPQYEGAKSFSNGIATVQQDGVWFLIDTNGERLGDENFASGGYVTAGNTCLIMPQDETTYRLIQFVG